MRLWSRARTSQPRRYRPTFELKTACTGTDGIASGFVAPALSSFRHGTATDVDPPRLDRPFHEDAQRVRPVIGEGRAALKTSLFIQGQSCMTGDAGLENEVVRTRTGRFPP